MYAWRNGAIGLLTVSALLLIFAADTWVRPWGAAELTYAGSSFEWRAKVAFAGALASAVCDLLLIGLMGLHDEKAAGGRRAGERFMETSGSVLICFYVDLPFMLCSDPISPSVSRLIFPNLP